MDIIDFKNIKEPFSFVKGKTEPEILDNHDALTDLLNCLWEIHNSNLASDQKCDRVKPGRV